MDLSIYKQIIKETMEAVAFNDPESAASKAEEKIKQYLDDNTAIPDDKKAELYAGFMQQIVVTTINQAIQAALQLPVQEKQVEVMERETAVKEALKDSEVAVNNQKIASMQSEDEARKNEVAAKVARAKVEIEQLIPAQIANMQKEAELKQKEIEVTTHRVEVEASKAEVAKAEVEIERNKIPLVKAQADLEKAKIPLMQAQAQTEQKKVDLMAKQVEVETRKVDLYEAQADIEKSKIPLVKAQTETEKAKAVLTKDQAALTEEEKALTKAKIDTEYWNAIMKSKQANTMARSIDANIEIEKCKCETNLKIAQLQAEKL